LFRSHKERQSALKPKGLFVADSTVSNIDGNKGLENLIEETENINEYFPLQEKKDGTFNSHSKKRVLSEEMFKHYSLYVMEKFKTATDEIYDGQTISNTIDTKGGLQCQICDCKTD